MKITKGELPPPEQYHFHQNVFWNVNSPVVLRKSKDNSIPDEPIDIIDKNGNRIVDPQIIVDDQDQIVIGNQQVIDQLSLVEVLKLSFKSPYEVTPEELAMIPDNGTPQSQEVEETPEARRGVLSVTRVASSSVTCKHFCAEFSRFPSLLTFVPYG